MAGTAKATPIAQIVRDVECILGPFPKAPLEEANKIVLDLIELEFEEHDMIPRLELRPLENRVVNMQEDNKNHYLSVLANMLQIDPKKRKTAK